MNKCEVCSKECIGKTCSGACRAKLSRRTRSQEDNKAHASLEHYRTHPELYVERVRPECLNWDEPMLMAELAAAGLAANRVAVPGDWDYAGVCAEQDGSYAVKPEHAGIRS